MPNCSSCGKHLARVRRSLLERVLFVEVFDCRHCGHRERRLRQGLAVRLAFLFSTRTCCIRCANPRIRRLARRDVVDALSRHPLSLLQRVTGAPINYCSACRLQYHDWRPVRSR